MGRAETPEGSWGTPTTTPQRYDKTSKRWVSCPKGGRADRWRARATLVLPGGKRVDVERHATTKEDAKAALVSELHERVRLAGGDLAESNKTVGEMALDWLADEVHDNADLKVNTTRLYDGTVRRHLLGQVDATAQARRIQAARKAGRLSEADESARTDRLRDAHEAAKTVADLKVGKLHVPHVEKLLATVAASSGPGAARTLRVCLTSVLDRAVRFDVIRKNPVRDVKRITRPKMATDKSKPVRDHHRGLDAAELVALYDSLAADRNQTMADVVRFMLGTGVRIGEALAVTWQKVDLTAGTVHIDGTIVRERAGGDGNGNGLVRTPPKTKNSIRTIALTPNMVAMLTARKGTAMSGPVFSADGREGHFRDPSMANKAIRRMLDRAGLDWATPHTFRRTVLTGLGDQGWPLRMVADLAGHSDPSMTSRVYLAKGSDIEAQRAALTALGA